MQQNAQNAQKQPHPYWRPSGSAMAAILITLACLTHSIPAAIAQAPQKLHNQTPRQPELDVSQSKGKQSSSSAKPFVLRETYHQQQSTVQSSHGVVGLDMTIRPDSYPIVQSVFPGTPAQQQGVRPRDILVAINGIRTYDKNVDEVDALISDVPGDTINLTVMRGAQLKQIRLTVVSVDSLSREMQASFSSLLPEPY